MTRPAPGFPSRQAGFALIVTIVLVAFIMLVLVSLATFTRVETQVADNAGDLAQARQNALYGLTIAIGELQRTTGPDQRITAPATTVLPEKGNPANPNPNTIFRFYKDRASEVGIGDPVGQRRTFLTPAGRNDFENDLRNWWNSNNKYKNPRWTAVFDSSLRKEYGISSSQYGEPKRDQKPIWLVSGNEHYRVNQATGSITWIKNNTPVLDSQYLTPETNLDDPTTIARPESVTLPNGSSYSNYLPEDVIEIVKQGNSASVGTSPPDGLTGKVTVLRQPITYTPPGFTSPQVAGHYAWWVSDESTKANFAVREPPPLANETNLTSSEYRARLQVPQRIGWERITGFESISFNVNDPAFEKVLTPQQIFFVNTNFQTPVRNNFHTLTAYSRSLFTDPVLGGLKKDLTVFFEGSGSGLDNSEPILDRRLYSETDPRFGGSNNNGFPRTSSTNGLPVWGQLKDWYDNDTGTLGPVLSNYQLFCAFTHKDGQLRFHMIPLITLWNPYNQSIPSATYTVRFRHNFGLWRFGVGVKSGVDPTPTNQDDGLKIGDYYIPPLSAVGWYATSNKFGTRFQANPWDSSSNKPNNLFSPFDLGTLYGPPKLTNSNCTWVPYTITTTFDAGEVKVFTMPPGQHIQRDGSLLHSGSQTVELVNDYDANRLGSFWMIVANGVTVDGTNSASSDNVVRWYGEQLNGNTPDQYSVEILKGGQLIGRYLHTGEPNMQRRITSSPWDEEPNVSNNPETWKLVYHYDSFIGQAPGSMDTRLRSSPIIGLTSARINPFMPTQLVEIYRGSSGAPFSNGDGVNRFSRAFAVHNFAAANIDLNFDLDYARAKDPINNADLFGKRRLFDTTENYQAMRWDDDNVSDLSGVAHGFALLGWQNYNSATESAGISNLQIRLARSDYRLLSLGQLQQANLSRYFWQPSFPIGNSEASPYVDRARIAGLQSYRVRNRNSAISVLNDTVAPNSPRTFPNNDKNEFFDISYALNEALWDRYFLSSIPQTGSFPDRNGGPATSEPQASTLLLNSRHRFILGSNPTSNDVRDFNKAARYLENVGALNVNSTSVEAWKALFTAFRDLKIQAASGEDNLNNTIPVSRNLAPVQGPVRFTVVPADYGGQRGTSLNPRRYNRVFEGFRYLSDEQIQALSERIVDEVRLRGPFFSVADFLNRRLVAPDGVDMGNINITENSAWGKARTMNQAPPASGGAYNNAHAIDINYNPLVGLTGITGALQRAINLSGINGSPNYPIPENSEDRVFRYDTDPGINFESLQMAVYPAQAHYLDSEHLAGAPVGEAGQLLSHAPGFVTQGDLLAMIGPALVARGDTFLIRAYGDSLNPATGEVQARAWLEAVVQRLPDFMDKTDSPEKDLSSLNDINKTFGRRYHVVAFRWLGLDDL